MNTQNNTPASRNEEAVKLLDAAMRFGHPLKNNAAYKELRAFLAAPGAAIDARGQDSAEDWGMVVDLARNVVRGDLPRLTEKGQRALAIGILGADQERQARLKFEGAQSEALSPATVAQPVAWAVRDTEGGSLVMLDTYHAADKWFTQNRGRLLKPQFLFCYESPAQPCASQGFDEDDPYYNLLGVIADAKAGNFDAVCVETLERVAAALSTAKSGGGATPEGGGE